jgi:hypothetical protein
MLPDDDEIATPDVVAVAQEIGGSELGLGQLRCGE